MVTGQYPFYSENPADIMRMQLRKELTPPDQINTELSSGLGEVVETMMKKNPENRYKSIRDLLIDLEALKEGRPPPLVHKKLGIRDLGRLKDGEPVDMTDYKAEADVWTARFVIAFAAALVLFLLCVLLLVLLLMSSG
jgi:serine/threonine-protein kinase